jgi:hypothetical protein
MLQYAFAYGATTAAAAAAAANSSHTTTSLASASSVSGTHYGAACFRAAPAEALDAIDAEYAPHGIERVLVPLPDGTLDAAAYDVVHDDVVARDGAGGGADADEESAYLAARRGIPKYLCAVCDAAYGPAYDEARNTCVLRTATAAARKEKAQQERAAGILPSMDDASVTLDPTSDADNHLLMEAAAHFLRQHNATMEVAFHPFRRIPWWDVPRHVACPRHQHAMALNAHMAASTHGCRITLNGARLVSDAVCLYPEACFGAGRLLYNDTVGALMMPDVTGAVQLTHGHSYTVVELDLRSQDHAKGGCLPPLSVAAYRRHVASKRSGTTALAEQRRIADLTHVLAADTRRGVAATPVVAAVDTAVREAAAGSSIAATVPDDESQRAATSSVAADAGVRYINQTGRADSYWARLYRGGIMTGLHRVGARRLRRAALEAAGLEQRDGDGAHGDGEVDVEHRAALRLEDPLAGWLLRRRMWADTMRRRVLKRRAVRRARLETAVAAPLGTLDDGDVGLSELIAEGNRKNRSDLRRRALSHRLRRRIARRSVRRLPAEGQQKARNAL